MENMSNAGQLERAPPESLIASKPSTGLEDGTASLMRWLVGCAASRLLIARHEALEVLGTPLIALAAAAARDGMGDSVKC